MNLFQFLIYFLGIFELIYARCPDHSFIGCMLRLKAQRVPIEKNILTLVFNIGTEARLLHTCKAYSATLPCFQEKIRECGDEKQKRVLNEVSKTIMYLCSPFSLQRQRLIIEHHKCISSVLSVPATTGCRLEEHNYGRQVLGCKKECSSRGSDFICMMRTWISEQNTCTLRDIDEKCGSDAANVFQELQTTVFEPSYPVICSFEKETEKIAEPKLSNLKEKKPKQHRKPMNYKSKTEIQENALILTSPKPSTIGNIYIAPPEQIQTNIYMRPQKPNMYTNQTNVFPTTTEYGLNRNNHNNIWRKENSQKVQYNKEVWRQKTTPGDFVFTTQHPLFMTTEVGATPKRHKVIDILRSLIPANLPTQLTSLLENSYEKQQIPDISSYNTPQANTELLKYVTQEGIPVEVQTISPKTSMIPPKQIMPQVAYRPSKIAPPVVFYHSTEPSLTTKWKPWYLGGT